MNPTWITLNPQDHGHQGWQKFTHYLFATQDHLCPVQMAELTQILPWYPLALLPSQSPSEQPPLRHLVALLGTHPGHNLYVTPQGQWQAPYVPAYYRGYPFSLNTQGELQFNTASGLLSADASDDRVTPFYTQAESGDDIQPTKILKQIKGFLHKCREGLGLTQRLVNQLQHHQLLENWTIALKNGQQTLKLQG